MSKIKYIILGVVCFVLALCLPLKTTRENVFAETNTIWDVKNETTIKEEIKKELEEFIEYGKGSKLRASRFAGSLAEYNSALYLYKELYGLATFVPVNDGSTDNGFQNFNFKSLDDGNISRVIVRRKHNFFVRRNTIFYKHYIL